MPEIVRLVLFPIRVNRFQHFRCGRKIAFIKRARITIPLARDYNPIAPIGQANFFPIQKWPAARDGIAELEMGAIWKRHRGTVVRMIIQVPNQVPNLVDALANENLLEADQIRLEALDPLPQESEPVVPRRLIVPDIDGEDLQHRRRNLAVD